MRISTQQIFRQSVGSMLDQQARIARTQQEINTGKRIQTASDDPVAATRGLDLQRSLDQIAQYDRNALQVENRLRLEEGAIGASLDILQRVRELVVGANNAGQSNESRQASAVEIRQQLEGLMQQANGQDGTGRYLFGGYQETTAPYSLGNTGQVITHAHDGQRFVQIGLGRSMADGDAGSAVFQNIPADLADPAAGSLDLFAMLDGIATALETPRDDATARSALNTELATALTQLDRGVGHLSDVRTTVGVRLGKLDQQADSNADATLQLTATLSAVQGVDPVEAYSRLAQQLTTLEAAQKAFVQVQGLSLFDYL